MVVHQLQLIQILLAVYQFVKSVLEAISTFLESHLLLFLNGSFSLFELGLQRVDLVLLILLLFKNDPLLLLHQVALLVEDLLDSLVNTVLHFLGLDSRILLVVCHVSFVVLDLLLLLLDLEFVLDVFLPEVVDLLGLLVHLDFSLGNLVNQLLCLALHICNEFDFLNVFPLEHINFDLHLLVLVSLDDKSFEQDVDLVDVIEFLEVGLKILIQHIIGLI